jgi:hypothetical protein
MEKIKTVRVFACGMTESGKDYLLKRLFLERVQRILIVDPLGEHLEPVTGVKSWHVYDVAGVRKALGEAARSGPRWRIVAQISSKAMPHVAALLVPAVIRRPGAFPQHVGGMALLCSELDLYASTSAEEIITGLWRRGRHVGLSVFAATQRPHGVSRSVTASSSWFLITRTQEPRDLRYLEDFLPAGAYREVLTLPWYHAVLVDKRAGAWYVLDKSQKVVRHGSIGLEAAG